MVVPVVLYFVDSVGMVLKVYYLLFFLSDSNTVIAAEPVLAFASTLDLESLNLPARLSCCVKGKTSLAAV